MTDRSVPNLRDTKYNYFEDLENLKCPKIVNMVWQVFYIIIFWLFLTFKSKESHTRTNIFFQLKVIAAEGEQKASRALKEAADVMAKSSAALQLRYLQTLSSISAEKNSTIIFPLPVDLISAFIDKKSWKFHDLLNNLFVSYLLNWFLRLNFWIWILYVKWSIVVDKWKLFLWYLIIATLVIISLNIQECPKYRGVRPKKMSKCI